MADAPSVVRFHYIKSNAYRVVHADGVVGGPTPNGLIHVSFFSERQPIPTSVAYAITDVGGGRGVLGEEEIDRQGKVGVVREVEVGVAMTLDMAKLLYTWLGKHIEKLDAAVQRAEAMRRAEAAGDAGGPDGT